MHLTIITVNKLTNLANKTKTKISKKKKTMKFVHLLYNEWITFPD